MKLNRKQKQTLLISVVLILIALLVWIGYGGEIFTKNEVLVERKDELLGTTYKEWKDQFVLGLDYTIGFIGFVFLTSALLLWKFKKRTE